MRTVALCSMVLAGALVIGCDSKSDNTTPTPPAVPTPPNHNSPTPEAAGHEAGQAAANLSDTAIQQAKDKLDQAMEYIKENKYDLADKALTELEEMKDKLPASLQSQIAAARSALNAAKSGHSLPTTLPSLPGGH